MSIDKHQPLYQVSIGTTVTFTTRDGQTIRGIYRGWLRDVDGLVRHRVGDGRARQEVADRSVASLTS